MSAFADLHPSVLVPNPGNRVHCREAVEEMAASIKQHGIIQSLLVVPLSDQDLRTENEPSSDDSGQPAVEPESENGPQLYQILVGHRRHAAAQLLGLDTVPCLIAEPGDQASHLLTMLTENLHRHDLSIQEEADYYAQLTLMDVSENEIASRLAFPVERVSAGLALTRLPRKTRDQAAELIAQHDLDLEQVLALEEFADDDEALQRLMLHATGKQVWSFRHILGEERTKRAKREAVEALNAELVLARVKIVTCPRDWYTGPYARAEDLLDRDGNPVDPDVAKTRPGFKAWIDQNGDPKAVIFCTDPEDWGYTRRTFSRSTVIKDDQTDADNESDADDGSNIHQLQQPTLADREADARRRREEQMRVEEAERAERQRQQEERIKAFTAATPIRRDFLESHFANAKAAKKALPQALKHVLTFETLSWDEQDADTEALMRRLAGIPSTIETVRSAVPAAGMDRLSRMAVAAWLCEEEDNLSRMIQRWRHDASGASAYLDLLVDAGYQLADVEQALRQEASPAPASDTTTDTTTDAAPTEVSPDQQEDQIGETTPAPETDTSSNRLSAQASGATSQEDSDEESDLDEQAHPDASGQSPEPLSA